MPDDRTLVLMGVSGSGKSTVAGVLAGQLGWDLAEGDDMHPAANVAKMAAGHPLDDNDRWPWLDQVATWIRAHTDAGRPGVITCSALRRSYRDVLRGEQVVFVLLAGEFQQIKSRLTVRHGHYMPVDLLRSQFDTLEPLGPDEHALTVDIGASPAELAEQIIERLRLVAA
jgi:carbohydrate kinase (thermoresistant glucokinase family)